MSDAPRSPAGVEGGEEANAGRAMAGSFATTAVIQVMQALIGVLLARELGPDLRGELAAVILIPTLIAAIGSLGIFQAVTARTARTDSLGTVVGTALVIVAVESVALIGIGLLLIPLILGDHDPGSIDDARVFLVASVPIYLVGTTMISALNGMHRFVWFQALRIAQIAVLALLLALLAADDGLSVRTASHAYLAGFGAMALGSLTRVLWELRGRVDFSRAMARDLLGFGLKSQLSTSMWNLNERGDQVVIAAFFSAATLGLYVVAVATTQLVTLMGFSFSLVALPVVARITDPARRRRTSRVIVATTFYAATAIAIPMLIFEPQVIRLLFGEDFSEAADVGRILLVGSIAFALSRVLESLLQALDRPLESSIGEGIALGVTAAGLAILLPTVGLIGAGITSLLAYTASAFFLARRASSALGIGPLDLLAPDRQMVGDLRSVFSSRARAGDVAVAQQADVDREEDIR